MISVSFDNIGNIQGKKTLNLSSVVFEEARAVYREIPAYRFDPIIVMRQGKRFCLLFWKSNNVTASRRQNEFRIATCEEYWTYSAGQNRMDLRLLQEADSFLFSDIDEYSIVIARIIKDHYPEKRLYYSDCRASVFFEPDFEAFFGFTEEEAIKKERGLLKAQEKIRMMKIGGPGSVSITKEQIEALEYSSLQVMHSIYWMSQEVHYGEKNPDRLIAMIKSPLAFEGLAGMLRYVLCKAAAVEESGFGAETVVDLGIVGDENQFFRGTGENVWEAYFEPLSPVSVSEAYDSAHVVCSMEAMKTADPWLWKEDVRADYISLIGKYLRFNAKTKQFLDMQYKETIPEHKGRILGVVGRGTDYNMTLPKGYKGKLIRPLTPEDILKKTIELVEGSGYEYVFLATEDQVVFDLYMSSSIKDMVKYVPQERICYSDHKQTDYLADIYKEQSNRDGYKAGLLYLGIINILSKCDALISTTLCGAAKIAWGLNGGRYEYMDVPGLTDKND